MTAPDSAEERIRSGGPMYQHIRQELLAKIRRGELQPGDRLASEREICEEYGVSVTTARRALLELVNAGVIKRRPGVGSIVSAKNRPARLAFLNIASRGDSWRETSAPLGELVGAIAEATWQRNATFSTTTVEDESEALLYLRRLVAEREVDGVLIRTANDVDVEMIDILTTGDMPYVVVKRRLPSRDMNCVIGDDVLGANIATSHLLDLGHRAIGFICGKRQLLFARERYSGYQQALSDFGVALDESLIRFVPEFSTDDGYDAATALLSQTSRPTAIFAASDTLAFGVYRAAADLGLSVPRDLSVIGHDDISTASLVHPPLTTVRTAYRDFGRLATDLLLDLVERNVLSSQTRVIQPELVVRESTAPPGGTLRPINGEIAERRVRSEGIVYLLEPSLARLGPGTDNADVGAVRTLAEGVEVASELHAAAAEGDERTRWQAAVVGLQVTSDIGAAIERCAAAGGAAADWLAQRSGGAVVLIAALNSATQPVPTVTADLVGNGLRSVLTGLADEWAAPGVRVNGVFLTSNEDATPSASVTATVKFLASESASALSGQLLEVDRGRREVRR
jgi:DNA-binding LacI/PurR family transcriptional regulator